MADPSAVPDDLRDPKSLDDVTVTLEAPAPTTDPTLGVPLSRRDREPGHHRLVSIRDSLTHRFQSFAIFNTDLSYPAVIASELGCYDTFRHSEYRRCGGQPLKLEYLARERENWFDASVRSWEQALRCSSSTTPRTRSASTGGEGGYRGCRRRRGPCTTWRCPATTFATSWRIRP